MPKTPGTKPPKPVAPPTAHQLPTVTEPYIEHRWNTNDPLPPGIRKEPPKT